MIQTMSGALQPSPTEPSRDSVSQVRNIVGPDIAKEDTSFAIVRTFQHFPYTHSSYEILCTVMPSRLAQRPTEQDT